MWKGVSKTIKVHNFKTSKGGGEGIREKTNKNTVNEKTINRTNGVKNKVGTNFKISTTTRNVNKLD